MRRKAYMIGGSIALVAIVSIAIFFLNNHEEIAVIDKGIASENEFRDAYGIPALEKSELTFEPPGQWINEDQ